MLTGYIRLREIYCIEAHFPFFLSNVFISAPESSYHRKDKVEAILVRSCYSLEKVDLFGFLLPLHELHFGRARGRAERESEALGKNESDRGRGDGRGRTLGGKKPL